MNKHLLLLITIFSFFAAHAQPAITSISPLSGSVGTSVTISGSGFSSTTSNNVVYFGPTKASITSASTTSLVVSVPNGGGTGKITVINTNSNGSDIFGNPFSITHSTPYVPSAASFTSHSVSVSNYVNPRSSNAYTSLFDPIASGDFDGDGKVDFVKVNGSVTTGKGADVYRNTSSGNANFSFGSAYNLPSTNNVGMVVVADFNNDGKLDIAIGSGVASNGISVFRNSSTSGTLNFNTSSTTSVNAAYPGRLRTADVNNDGKIDLIYSGTYASSISVALNTTSTSGGSITFGTPSSFITGLSGCRGFVIGDLNNDGADDIVTAESSYKAHINNNTSSSLSFATPFTIATGYYGWSSQIKDINRDGKNDLIMSQLNGSGPKLYQNNYSSGAISAASFGTAKDLSGSHSQDGMAIADISGDGTVDVASVNTYIKLSTNLMSASQTIGGTNSEFSSIYVNSSYASAQRGILAEDFDGDGKVDILVHNALSSSNTVSIYENRNGEVVFYPKSTGNLHTTSTWGNNADGTGTSPTNLTDASTGYKLANRTSYSLTSNTTISNLTLDGTYPLDIGAFTLEVNKSILGYNSNSYIKSSSTGTLKMEVANTSSVTFPIGNSAYNPVTITNNTGTDDDFTVRVLDEVYASGTSGAAVTGPRVKRTWDIGKTTSNSSSGVDFVFNWNSGEAVNITTPALYHYGSSSWTQQTSGTTSSTSTSLTYTGYTGTFSPFAVGENGTPLPVDLMHFDVHAMNNHEASIQWTTASEINNSHFNVERSYDGRTFEVVGEVAGNGNSQHLIEYSYTDASVSKVQNTVYYRLKQVDFDGAYEHSDIRVVRFDEVGRGIDFSSYPNPITDELNVMVNIPNGEAYQISVTNLQGANVYHENHTFNNGIHKLNTSAWNSGMYILSVASDQGTKFVKVVKK